ncbi:MAG: MerR family transcriptional regulator [Actinophytocola sp.]|uniref:MerR family transcriptional regulator n=1 Tax=Actinophytocola sp. TaxID=1872138 RepID=UPI00132B4A36|nr:MerR family transcriptional regulator [Actinophytocola sp.]MPZ80194.1 MerR family transcriptional regulator [Actinophytocola sp.]
MFGIGDFARHGQVSVRMLRHYDALGLLRPAHVDHATGYRLYQARQLARLNRIIALKGLGFTLGQVGELLDEPVGGERLRGMLQLRQAEVQARIAEETDRLRRVEARLRLIESEGHMPTEDVVLKSIPAQRVAELTAIAASWAPEDIGPVIQPLYRDLCDQLDKAGVTPTGPAVARYEDVPDGGGKVVVHATLPVDRPLGADGAGFGVVDLPPLAKATTIVHRGEMENILPTEQALAAWVERHGYRSLGYPREVDLECPRGEFDRWVTELQLPVG